MRKAERKIARIKFLARLEPIDPELAKEVREMWEEEEEEGRHVRPDGREDVAAVARSAAVPQMAY